MAPRIWGRDVPGVRPFDLEVVYDRGYGLRLRAPGGNEFWLGSDGIIPTWSTPGWTKRFALDLVAEIALDADNFYRIASTFGGYIIFPRNRAGQTGWTINQSRGMNSAIADRFDLTLECIRRHYSDPAQSTRSGSVSVTTTTSLPCSETLIRMSDSSYSRTSSSKAAAPSAPLYLVTPRPALGCLPPPLARRCMRSIAGGHHFRHGAQRADPATRLLAGS